MRDRIIRFLRDHEREMLLLLRDMVVIQSGSYNKPGLDRLGAVLLSALKGNAVRAQVVEQARQGNHLVCSTPAVARGEKQILVTGHMDTVFPEDTDFTGFREDEDRVYGPGVVDMKGGLVIAVYGIKALEAAGVLSSLPVTCIFNSDEEIGSPGSRDIIERAARQSAFAFVLESGGLSGEVVTGRKGKMGLQVRVRGEAGHAGFSGMDKPSAILALARKIVHLEALNDSSRGMTVNVGTIKGGMTANTVPEAAEASVEARYRDGADRFYLEEKIGGIVEAVSVPGTSAEWFRTSERPLMEPTAKTARLYAVVEEQGKSLGLPVREEFRSGVSDANLIAGQQTPVIDGLGPLGGSDHTRDEYMIKKSLCERAQLFTLSLLESWKRYCAGALF